MLFIFFLTGQSFKIKIKPKRNNAKYFGSFPAAPVTSNRLQIAVKEWLRDRQKYNKLCKKQQKPVIFSFQTTTCAISAPIATDELLWFLSPYFQIDDGRRRADLIDGEAPEIKIKLMERRAWVSATYPGHT